MSLDSRPKMNRPDYDMTLIFRLRPGQRSHWITDSPTVISPLPCCFAFPRTIIFHFIFAGVQPNMGEPTITKAGVAFEIEVERPGTPGGRLPVRLTAMQKHERRPLTPATLDNKQTKAFERRKVYAI